MPPLAYSKRPLRSLVRAGEGADLVAEQLVVEQVFIEGGAVERRERLVLARAVVVDGAGDQFLAGTGLAEDEDRGVGGCDGLARLDDLVHGRAVADDAFEAELRVELPLQLAVGLGQTEALGRLVHDGAQLGEIDGFREIVGRPLLDGLHGRFHVAVASDHDDLGVGRFVAGLAQNGQAVQVRHLQIGDNHIEIVLLDPPGPGRATGGYDAFVADTLQALGHRLGVKRLVVDDENF